MLMRTQIHLHDGSRRSATPPFRGADHAAVPGSCPACRAEPFRVAGRGLRVGAADEYHADGYCLDCRARVGRLVAQVSTLFGLEEDARVLGGAWRVY